MKEGEGEDGRVVKGRHAIKVASEEPLVHYLGNHQHACPGRQHQHHQEKDHQQTKAQNIRNDQKLSEIIRNYQHPVPDKPPGMRMVPSLWEFTRL